jgi:EAL domain-containing protein (putative c-di-GMP-specific phosphodiesterase class I)
VETAEQAEHLRSLGCLSAQGYFFSKPLPADDIPALVAAAFPAGKMGP